MSISITSGLTGKKLNTINPTKTMIRLGMANDQPHPNFRRKAASNEPAMFPIEVCAFHMPIINPLLLLPNQFPTTATTEGHPID
uniref:Uncharacterized protein n=1 Tax=Arundo donax TaxID=35708 RepID=A0A0A9EJ97_ARUDO